MARAYAAFANGGYRIDGAIFGNEPRVVACLEDDDGQLQEGQRDRAAHRVLEDWQADTVNQMLQGVVSYGTGKAARLSGYPVAGKTGTTENYGDAWFVGYTPDLVTAVWVGYPDELRPMLTEYHGRPVAGGTYPALIWKAFMENAAAVPARGHGAGLVHAAAVPRTRRPQHVVLRDRKLELDNGHCSDTTTVQLFTSAQLPHRRLRCELEPPAEEPRAGEAVAPRPRRRPS